MSRIQPIHLEQTDEKAKALLDSVQKKLGMVPNLMKTLAHSPATLGFYLNSGEALSKGSLSGKIREQIALTVAQENGCRYCLAAHSAIGRSLGLSDEAIRDARQGQSPDSRTGAILEFAQKLVTNRGQLTDPDFEKVRQAGVTDAEITEIVATVAINIFSNYFNIATQIEVDFPAAPELETSAA